MTIEEIKERPYDYICDYYEKLFPHMGGDVMRILSLVPCSLIMPKFKDKSGKETSQKISFLLLANPGTGKTALSEHFSKFTYDNFPFEYITDAKLSKVLKEKDRVTVITSDVARIFSDKVLAKQIENIIGDEGKISRMTMKTNEEEQKIDAVGYFAGTPSNLSKVITDGLIFRVSPLVKYHTAQEHEEILKKVNNRIGNSEGEEQENKEDLIKDYYQMILRGVEEKDLKGFTIPALFRKEIEEKLIPLFRNPFNQTGFEFIREINQTYKYMAAHAVLNIFNRKITRKRLILEDEDLRVAMRLSEREIEFKCSILKCINIVSENKLRTLRDFDYWAREHMRKGEKKINALEYKILKTIIRAKF